MSGSGSDRHCENRFERSRALTGDTELEKFRQQGFTPEQVIRHSIANEYQGLFAPKGVRPETLLRQVNTVSLPDSAIPPVSGVTDHENIATGGVLERIRRLTPPHVTAPFRTVAEWREWQLAEGQKRCEEINRLNRQLRVEKIPESLRHPAVAQQMLVYELPGAERRPAIRVEPKAEIHHR